MGCPSEYRLIICRVSRLNVGPQKATDLLFDNEAPKVTAPTQAIPMEQLELDDNAGSSPTIRHSHRGQGVRTFNFLAVYG